MVQTELKAEKIRTLILKAGNKKMFREVFVIASFLFILSGIAASVIVVEKIASRQISIAEKIIGSANETE